MPPFCVGDQETVIKEQADPFLAIQPQPPSPQLVLYHNATEFSESL